MSPAEVRPYGEQTTLLQCADALSSELTVWRALLATHILIIITSNGKKASGQCARAPSALPCSSQ